LLAGALFLVHALALAAAWVGLGGWARYLAWAGILASLVGWLTHTSRQARSLELHEDGRASWADRKGDWREGRLGRSTYVSPVLVILELKPGGKGRRWMVLMGDSAPAEDLRRLRVWLRWRRERAHGEGE